MTYNGLRVGPFFTISDVFLLAGGLLLILSLMVRPTGYRVLPSWLFITNGIVLIPGLLSMFISDNLQEDILGLTRFMLAALFVPVILGEAGRYEHQRKLLINGWIIFTAFNAGIAFSDLVLRTSIGWKITGFEWLGRTGGLAVHPNHLGLACAMALPVSLVQMSIVKQLNRQLIWLLIPLALMVGVLVSGSRAALIGSGAGLVMLCFLNNRLIKPLLLIFIISLLLLSIAVKYQPGIFDLLNYGWNRLLGGVSVGESDAIRLEYYSETYLEFIENPLIGVGFGIVRRSHNIYLQILQAGGALALIGFLAFIVRFLLFGWNLTLEKRMAAHNRDVAKALLTSIVIWLIVGLVQNQISDRFLYIPMGLILSMRYMQNRKSIFKRTAMNLEENIKYTPTLHKI
jgi:O-antigen ligase